MNKDNFAYMVTRNPYAKIGMAKPLRIRKIYGELKFHICK